MKFAICNETYQGWSWQDACQHASQCGYDGIEVAPFTLCEDVHYLTSDQRADIRRTARDAGLEIVGLHWLLVSPPGLSMTSPDPLLREITAEMVCELVDVCGDLGGKVMVFGSPKQRRIPEGETAVVARNRFLKAIRPGLDRALERGVTICLEPLPAPEANLLLTLDEARDWIDRLNHPAAATIFDVKSACSEGKDLGDLCTEHITRIAHVHANDANRRGPGFGDTDFVPVMRALKKGGYKGFVSVEVFDYSPDPETIARESLKHLKDVWNRV